MEIVQVEHLKISNVQ